MRSVDELEAVLALVLDQGATFAAFREPGSTARLMIQRDLRLRPVARAEPGARGFLIAPFEGSEADACWLRPDIEYTIGEAPDFDPGRLKGFARIDESKDLAQGSTSHEQHRALVDQALLRIEAGEMDKVVLARTKRACFDTGRTAALFVELMATYPSAFVCLFRSAEHGTWIGASPERLVAVDEGCYTVDALAGTRPVEDAPLAAHEWGLKECDEQAWVERDIRSKLTLLGLPPAAVHGPEVHGAGPVVHLRTRFSGPVDQVSVARIASALHPTPAVCGTPQGPALDFIRRNEPQRRRLYAGYWGPWAEKGRSALYVNLRCMELDGEGAVLHLGGGITAGSDAAHEWEETELKALTLERPMAAVRARIS